MAAIRYTDLAPDAGRYLELFETTGWNSMYAASARDLACALASSWYVISAYEDSQLVGSGRIVSDGVLYAMIYDMVVRPSHKGRGIGTAILNMLIDKCRAEGLREIQLFAARGTEAFYARHGFGRRPDDAPGMRYRSDSRP